MISTQEEWGMRYLIIGGTSIFGAGLIELLLSKQSTEFVAATKLPDENRSVDAKLTWLDLDVRDADEVGKIVRETEPDVIFDFATQDSVGYAWQNPTETVDINVIGTINLLNAVRDHWPKARLVIGGSGEEYGMLGFSSLPAKEAAKPQPCNIYGATKACQTLFAKLYHQAFGLDIIVLRTFYETSVHQDERFAVSSFCKQFAEIQAGLREPVLDTGNLNNIRDFTDVDDLVWAFDVTAERGISGEVYNAGNGKSTSLLDIVHILENLTGVSVEVKMSAERVRPIDSPSIYADIEKLKNDTGWEPRISIEEMVGKLLRFWRKTLTS